MPFFRTTYSYYCTSDLFFLQNVYMLINCSSRGQIYCFQKNANNCLKLCGELNICHPSQATPALKCLVAFPVDFKFHQDFFKTKLWQSALYFSLLTFYLAGWAQLQYFIAYNTTAYNTSMNDLFNNESECFCYVFNSKDRLKRLSSFSLMGLAFKL